MKAKDYQTTGNYYSKHKIQFWDIVEEYDMDLWTASAVKYLLRYKDKNGVEDLKKAQHYIAYLIEKYESKTTTKITEPLCGGVIRTSDGYVDLRPVDADKGGGGESGESSNKSDESSS